MLFQAQSSVITKALPGRPMGGKLPSPVPTWCTASALGEIAVKNSASQSQHHPVGLAHTQIHIPSLSASIQRLPSPGCLQLDTFQVPSLRLPMRHCGMSLKTLFSTMAQQFSLLALLSFPPWGPRFIKWQKLLVQTQQ